MKVISYGIEAREKLRAGVEQLYKAVSVTLGPRGRNVVYSSILTGAASTKDGVTVANQVQLSDPIENTGMWLVREASRQTASEAGDGTTTAIVLAYAIFSEGLRYVTAGSSVKHIKNGIGHATEIVVKGLNKMSKKIDESKLEKVTTMSANGDVEIGRIVASAIIQAGPTGVITIEKSPNATSYIEKVEGLRVQRGVVSPYFINLDTRGYFEIEDVVVVLYDKIISTIHDAVPLLEFAAQEQKPVLLMAEDITSEALTAFLVNKMRGVASIYPIRLGSSAVERMNILHDVEAITNASILYRDKGHTTRDVNSNVIGRARKVKMNLNETIIVGSSSSKLNERVEQLRKSLSNPATDPNLLDDIKKRIASLTNGIIVIKVGGYTDVEVQEKIDRVDDALHAGMAALEEGIVPGGGVALLRARKALMKYIENYKKRKKANVDFIYGMDILAKAIKKPFEAIISNAGGEPSHIAQLIQNKPLFYGYNAETGQVEDLYKTGIIDPKKVVRMALQNASTVASLMLTTECVIAEVQENKKQNH